LTAIAAAAVFLGAALQSATGFGFALVSAPILFAILGPQEAVTAGVVLGLELSLLTLATERRRPRVLRGEAVALVGWSLPGVVAGAIALRELPDGLLSAVVALAVLAALALRLRFNGRARAAVQSRARGAAQPSPRATVQPSPRAAVRPRPRAAFQPSPRAAVHHPWQTAAAGAASGALSTSTSLSGPPLVFHLLARGASPEQMRDTLAAIFVALALLSAAALVVTATFDVPAGVLTLAAAAVAGQLFGRRAFAWLGDRYETAVLTVLAMSALLALGSSAV